MAASPRRPSARLARLLAGLFLPALLLAFAAGLAAQGPGKKPPVEEQEDPKAPKKKPPVVEDDDPMPPKKKPPPVEDDDPKAPKKKPPPVEEVEEKGTRPKRKVIRVDDDDTPPKPPVKPPKLPVEPLPDSDLIAAAKQAKNVVVKELFAALGAPHDLVTVHPNSGKRRVERVEPLTKYYPGERPQFTGTLSLRILDQNWKPAGVERWNSAAILRILPYEMHAQALVDEFLKSNLANAADPAKRLAREEQFVVAQQVLAAVVRAHESLRERGVRDDPAWDKVEEGLRKKLFEVEINQLKYLAEEKKDWDGAVALARRLVEVYPNLSDTDRGKILGPLGTIIVEALKQGDFDPDQAREVQERLQVLNEQLPGGAVGGPINDGLRKRAQAMFDRGRDLIEKENKKTAGLEMLRQARGVYPRLPGLEDYYLRQQNLYPVLNVGVRELPVNMAPGLAVTESERAAVELLFEGLVKGSDEPGAVRRYELGLAEARPRVVPLGRQFQISRQAFWATTDQPVTAADVRATVRNLKNPKWPGHSPAWADLIDEVQLGGDPQRVTLTLRQGYLDPLALMTFKVLPPGLTASNYERFAQRPYGSGPYQLRGVETVGGRPHVIFDANPNYGARPGKRNLPRIREIHFFRSDDPAADFKNGKLDLLLPEAFRDLLASKDAKKLQALEGVASVRPLPTRRVYFLAVNHHNRRPDLQSADFRRALAYAVPREQMLDEFFRREPGEKVHKALTGPYPAGSWANDPGRPSLDRPERAGPLLDQLKNAGLQPAPLTLKYPTGDRQAEAAMRALAEHLAKLGLEVTPEAVEERLLRQQVEKTHSYDLAYYHHDFDSEAYWLWPLFDPRGSYLGYKNDGELVTFFGEAMLRRNFAEVRDRTHLIHAHLQAKMPLIPLWQLDARVAVHPDLQPVPFDPLVVFTDAERWGKQKK